MVYTVVYREEMRLGAFLIRNLYEFMSQDNLIRLVSQGDENGVGKGHVIWSHKNTKKLRTVKLHLKKFNPIAKKHTAYVEKKKK